MLHKEDKEEYFLFLWSLVYVIFVIGYGNLLLEVIRHRMKQELSVMQLLRYVDTDSYNITIHQIVTNNEQLMQ